MKLLITIEGQAYEVEVEVLDDTVGAAPAAPASPAAPAAPARSAPPAPRPSPAPAAAAGSGDDKKVTAPMLGTVLKVLVKPGDAVEVNQQLLTLEAMKMEAPVSAPAAGTVKTVHVSPGDAITAGQLLVEFE